MCSRLIFLKEIKEKDFRFQKRPKEPCKQHKKTMMFDSLIVLKNNMNNLEENQYTFLITD